MGILEFLHVCERLKTTKRTGWVLREIPQPESISDHMHRMALISMLLPNDPSIDKNRAVKMAIVHDLAEAIVGDIPPSSSISKEQKYKLENDAIDSMVQTLGNSVQALEIKQLWLEYERAATPEALLVKDIDKFEMIVQAFEYESRNNVDLQEFYDSTRDKFHHPFIKDLVNELYSVRKGASH